MLTNTGRRRFVQQFSAVSGLYGLGLLGDLGAALAAPTRPLTPSKIAAAWRGPGKDDPYFAGFLVADWEAKRLSILSATRLPTRPHGLLPESHGGLLVIGVRPGSWMLRLDSEGNTVHHLQLGEGANEGACRFNGHAVLNEVQNVILTTETDHATGRGRIGVRDPASLRKVDEWDSHGLEPHQLLMGEGGRVYIANGGIPRTLADKKYDLHRMDASLVCLDGGSGNVVQQWKTQDPRLSLRHLAWSNTADDHGHQSKRRYLGIAMQSEHESPAERANAPILAVLAGDELIVPETNGDPAGYAGDIAPAFVGGFALSSNVSSVARVWHPGMPEKLTPIVELPESYALTGWHGSSQGGVLVATAPGLVRWHPVDKPQFLAWPQPMVLDNHWALVS